MSIRNVIFDFGGVIIDICHQRLEKAFVDLGLQNFDLLFSPANQSELFRRLETGKIKPDEFRLELKKMIRLDLPDAVLDDTWNQIIGDYPPHRIDLLKQTGKNYKLFILSNTNEIHYKYYIQKFSEEYGFPFISLFVKVYWSFEIGKRKPDKESYQHVLEHSGLNPEETLFIDDAIQNIVAAKNCGLVTHYLKTGEDISELFQDGWLIGNRSV